MLEPIPGFRDRYEASSLGRIRRAEGLEGKTGYRFNDPYLKLFTDKKTGYIRTRIMRDGGRSYNVGVHQLVAAAFHGPCPDGMEVNHINLDKANNRPENLEYLTHAENIRQARMMRPWSNGRGNATLTEENVREVRLLLSQGLSHREIAERYGVTAVCITLINTGKTWAHVR